MKQVDDFFSAPSALINKNFEILSFSEELSELTRVEENFLDTLDEASVNKVKNQVTPSKPKNKLEVNIKPKSFDSDPIICDLYVKWINDLQADILLISKGQQMTHVTTSLNQLRSRLNSTNFELLEEKEKLQQSIELNNRLSAPLIIISSSTGLVPLLGDINAEKMTAISHQLLASAQDSDVDHLLFDFTGVGEIGQHGFVVFNEIIQSLSYMGIQIVIVGVNPQHSMKLKNLHINEDINFINSLQLALEKYNV